MKHWGKTLRFRGPQDDTLPGSVAEIRYLPLGGLDQWVMIRGESVANPILILLHGGPGFPEMRLFRHFNAALEKSFTVVYWEQRGTGKSFDRRTPKSSMTVAQFIVRGLNFCKFVRIVLGEPESSIFDLSNILRGFILSKVTWPEVSALNLMKSVPALQVPVFFFIGRHDHVVDPAGSVAYFDMLTAPSKTFVWFEDSAHEPPAEEPAKFNTLMAELVRPVAQANASDSTLPALHRATESGK